MIGRVKVEDESDDFTPIINVILMQKIDDEYVRKEEFHYNGH